MYKFRFVKNIALLLTLLMVLPLIACYSGDGHTDTPDVGNTGNSTGGITTDDTTDETTAAVEPDYDNVRISFLAAGDNIGHTNVYTDALNRANENTREYNFLPMYNDIAPLVANTDIAFINQETLTADISVSGGEYCGYPKFNSPQDMGRTLVDLGFDVVNIATNHMLDFKAAGLESTIEFWETQPVMMIGGYKNEEDFNNIRVYEEQGVKIAFISFTFINDGLELDAGSDLYIPYVENNDEAIIAQIEAAKKVGDLVFASMHWGVENSFTTSYEQRRVAQLLADNGVDVVIGHHPHVVQEVKWVERDDGGRMLLIYSLGNLISTMQLGQNMVGGLATFDIVRENGGDPYIDNPVFIPTITHFNMSRRGLQVYLLENYNESLASAHGCLADDPGFTYQKAISYIVDTIDKEFLPEFYQDK